MVGALRCSASGPLRPWYALLLVALFSTACQESPLDIGYHWRGLKVGDDYSWAAQEYDDSAWDANGQTEAVGVFWVRFKIEFGEQAAALNQKGMHVISTGSYEAFWDGVRIGANGKVGKTLAEEVPGAFISYLLLPDSLAHPGEHTLALRVSNHRSTSLNWQTFYVNEFEHVVQRPLLWTAAMYLLAGVYFIVGIYYLFLSFSHNKTPAVRIFSWLCFVLFTLILVEYLKFTYQYPYYHHTTRLLGITGLTFIASCLTPLFFLLYFNISNWKLWMIIITAVQLLLLSTYPRLGYDYTAMLISLTTWVCIFLINNYAYYRKRSGAGLLVIVSLLIASINLILEFQPSAFLFQYDISLFASYTLLIIAMLYLLAKEQQAQSKAYEDSLLQSVRLQNQLLKKNIQPHFILNTLTSLIDWVEEAPEEGVKFIEALASEFRLFNKMADEKLIFIEQEIELCRKYLEIMSYRKEVCYEWEQCGIDLEDQIPPAILHTIVENGITHSLPDASGSVRFLLRFEQNEIEKSYTLSTFAQNREATATSAKKQFGLDYVRSRLAENYGSAWSVTPRMTEFGWETKITIGIV